MLIAVKHLEKLRRVQQPRVKGDVTYRHILFDRHEVIYANGLPTESLLIGDEARRKLPRALLEDHPQAGELREKLTELRELIAQDHALLEKMTEATGTIIQELDRIRDRHSLSGTYGPNGEKRAKNPTSSQHFDQSL